MIWKRGRTSRRLSLLFWAAVILLLFVYYRSIIYTGPSPFSPGSEDERPEVERGSQQTTPASSETPGSSIDVGADSAKYFVKSGYDWSKLRRQYPIVESEMSRPPQGPPKHLNRVQFNFPRIAYSLDVKQHAQREAVKAAFRRCWDSYMDHGFPHDELLPVSLEGKDTFGGWSATLVDALDTLYIMGMKEEFVAALPAIGTLDWAETTLTSINVFETTIRYLGGLLSAYDLSGEKVILLKAVELGELLYVAFDTPNHMPPFVSTTCPCYSHRRHLKLLALKTDPFSSGLTSPTRAMVDNMQGDRTRLPRPALSHLSSHDSPS